MTLSIIDLDPDALAISHRIEDFQETLRRLRLLTRPELNALATRYWPEWNTMSMNERRNFRKEELIDMIVDDVAKDLFGEDY